MIRNVKQVIGSEPTLEGAGVHLRRAFGFQQVPNLDPFLLLDDFHSDNPEHYIKGFPWHPHRGIETITYVLYGHIEHSDSLGNKGVITEGDVQWMTAGSGIIHQEMPKPHNGDLLWGFQLWANLPASQKMMEPRYRDVKSEQIPTVELQVGIKIKIICGKLGNTEGPVKDIVIDPEYLDVSVPAGATFNHTVKLGYTVFAYVTHGAGFFDSSSEQVDNEHLVVYGDGTKISVTADISGLRFLLISGKPLNEPVAWQGPIVMNTQEELELAFKEYRDGTFIKHKDGR